MPANRVAYSSPISLDSDHVNHLIAAELAAKLFVVALRTDACIFEQVARREIAATLNAAMRDGAMLDVASSRTAATPESNNVSSQMLAGDIVRAISMATPRNPQWEAHARVIIATMLSSIRGNPERAGYGIGAPHARSVTSPQAA
jgi:hypothetical protein